MNFFFFFFNDSASTEIYTLPYTALFRSLADGAHGYASTRIKMGKSGDVIAVVKADGKLYTAKKGVKVTIGGCGG